MANTVGLATSYDLTVGVKINIDDMLYLLSPVDTPMLTGVGADGLTVVGSEPVDERVFSWLHDSILTPRSALAASATTGDAFIVVTTGDRPKFSTGDTLRIGKVNGTEVMRVTGYGSTADSLTVTRAFAGTATNYVTSDIVIGLGTALAEGSDPEAARSSDRTEASNVTQIFGPTSVHLSRTEQQVSKYGVANEFTHQLMQRMQENAISREQAFLYGRKTDSTTTKIRTTGGLVEFITTNKDTTSTQLTASTIQSRQMTGFNRGGFADVVMANPVSLADLNDLANTSIVRETLDDPRRGRVRVSYVDTEFGSVLIARNRWVWQGDAFGFSRENVIRRIMQPLIMERLAKTGDADKAQIVCEEGLEVKGESHLFWLSNLSYTGAV